MQAAATHLRKVPDPPKKLENLFNEHHEQVFRTAYRITGSVVDAEDVLQTIFLRIVRREQGRGFSPSPGSYLHRAAVNAALDLCAAVAGQKRFAGRSGLRYDRKPRPSPPLSMKVASFAQLFGRQSQPLDRKPQRYAPSLLRGLTNREIAENARHIAHGRSGRFTPRRTRLRKRLANSGGNHEAL